MTKSILQDLYYGRISPWERHPVDSVERKEINRKIEDQSGISLQKCRWMIASGSKNWKRSIRSPAILNR